MNNYPEYEIAKISSGNSKLGRIPNINLPPILTCRKDAPCKNKCYAMKAYRQYPNVRHAWMINYLLFQKDPNKYFNSIISQLKTRKKLDRFRWHSGGDIINQTYFDGMKDIARAFPKCKFLAYTKNDSLEYNDIPGNLIIRFSMWNGINNNSSLKYISWVDNGQETRIPKKHFKCKNDCSICNQCWKKTKSIVFKLH